MASLILFLGSGASVPFGLPTMKDLVVEFEKELQNSSDRFEQSGNAEEHKKMASLYRSIKYVLADVYSYVDLESIFSVLKSIAEDIKYSELGFTSTYIISRLTSDPKRRIALDDQKDEAIKLLEKYRDYVRKKCNDSNIKQERVNEVFTDLYEQLGSKFPSFKKINGDDGSEYTYPHGCSIYTTNYDDVVETYWRGAAEINNLWRNKSGTHILDVDKYEGDMLNLIKLHGSLDWFGLNDGLIIKLSNTNVSAYAKRKVTGEFMLYPIQQKDLYLYPWFNLLYRFKRDLETTKTWIVIGYSFNDEFILNIFREALDRGKHKLIIVSPDATRVTEDKFSKYNVKSVLGKFGERKTVLDILSALDDI